MISQLIFTVVDSPESMKVLANVAHSYEMFRATAKRVQTLPQWKKDAKVQALKFTDKWVKRLLDRHMLRRHRLTTETSKRPPTTEVVKTMAMRR